MQFEVEAGGGALRCTNFIVFWNFDDVSLEDGGLILIPGK